MSTINGSITDSPRGEEEPALTQTPSTSGAPVATIAAPPPAYPMSFNHIVELITTGQPIPGVKEIPDTVLEGQASHSTTSKRRKPWEKDEVLQESAAGEDTVQV